MAAMENWHTREGEKGQKKNKHCYALFISITLAQFIEGGCPDLLWMCQESTEGLELEETWDHFPLQPPFCILAMCYLGGT